jgi:hypothetical protein
VDQPLDLEARGTGFEHSSILRKVVQGSLRADVTHLSAN